MLPSPSRGTIAPVVLGLVVSAFTLLSLSSPAQAAPVGCQDETISVVVPAVPETGCDDVTPPGTALTTTPAPTSGVIAGSSIQALKVPADEAVAVDALVAR